METRAKWCYNGFMFGYVTPLVCEMKVCEHELYQAYYCGLCKVLQKKYHKSIVLNYDCTFIYVLGDSLRYEDTDVKPCKCMLHPIKKKQAVSSAAAEYAADVNLLLAFAKLRDDEFDSRSLKARLRLPFYNGAYRRAEQSLPEIARMMGETERALRELERAGSADTDETADTYAKLFGNILMDLDVVQSHILYDIGYSMGRWVYLIDAFDDIGQDIKNCEYNVFVNKYGIKEEIPQQVKEEVEFNFNFTLSQAMAALDKLELKKNRGILKNIICLGMKERTRQVLGKGSMDESIPSAGR
ncbi:DUF5685 family protein [Christensenellaceae bacterium OttesenSCG-928-K19]|nr:DUF5685 family protein [Christensenellaceae bacterium OttesenSCG-928-K19]